MIHTLKRANIEAVKYNLALQLIPVQLDVVVLNHDDHHIHVVDEIIEVVELVLCNLVVLQEWVVALQWTGKVTLLQFQHLESGRLAIIVNILLICKAIETHLAVVGDVVLLHNLMDAVEDKLWLRVVSFHGLINNLCQTWIVTYKEPRVNGDAMTTYTRARLEDVYTWVHIADADYLIHIHIVMTADTSQLISKGNVYSTEGILNNLGHLGTANISYDNLALAETSSL